MKAPGNEMASSRVLDGQGNRAVQIGRFAMVIRFVNYKLHASRRGRGWPTAILWLGLLPLLAGSCKAPIMELRLHQHHLYDACSDQPKSRTVRTRPFRTPTPQRVDGLSLSSVDTEMRRILGSKQYAVDEGSLYFFSKEDCNELSNCYGNNPASPYGLFMLPPRQADRDSVAGRLFSRQGRVPSWRLARNEAVVFLGHTPPRAAYFGFTSYLFDRKGEELFASLGDTLNLQTIRVAHVEGASHDGPFDAPVMIIQTANQVVADTIIEASVASGFPRQAINLQVLPDQLLQLGLDRDDDMIMSLLRVAYVQDEAAGNRYLKAPPASIFRVRGPAEVPFEALERPPLREAGGGASEASLLPAFEAFDQAVRQHYGNATSECLHELRVQGDDCIAGNYRCIGDNRDTPYLLPVPRTLAADEMLVIYGVRHDRSKLASYVNLSVTEIERRVGIASVAGESLTGSAQPFVPQGSDPDRFFVYRFARDCRGEKHCFELSDKPTTHSPPGIPIANKMVVVWRVYLQAISATAPLVGDILAPRYFVTNR